MYILAMIRSCLFTVFALFFSARASKHLDSGDYPSALEAAGHAVKNIPECGQVWHVHYECISMYFFLIPGNPCFFFSFSRFFSQCSQQHYSHPNSTTRMSFQVTAYVYSASYSVVLLLCRYKFVLKYFLCYCLLLFIYSFTRIQYYFCIFVIIIIIIIIF